MGVEVALALGRCEIVSCDSMGVYRHLDIAADKPSGDDRRGVPHHLFDVAEPTEDMTAVRYRTLARAAVDGIVARRRLPLLVGGSGLWFRAVTEDLEFAPTDPRVRARLSEEDPAVLWERLVAADPDAAARIDPRNPRRIVRAVEILELTGAPPSELRRTWETFQGPYDLKVVALTWERGVLLERARERVHAELAAGLLDEVRRVARDHGISRTARQALGVKEMLEHIEGRLSLEEATELLVRNTKAFVRRQISWFRSDPRVEWIDASALGWDGARTAIVERFRPLLDVVG